MVELSKDAQKLLSVLYKTYRARLKAGMTKRNSRDFQFNKIVEIRGVLGWSQDDLLETERELINAGFLRAYMMGACELEDPAIIYMENRSKNQITDAVNVALDIASKFVP